MKEYIYKKVEGMTVGQVVDAMVAGTSVFTDGERDYEELSADCTAIYYITYLINKGELYIREEKPWWEYCKGSVIMVRDNDQENWLPDIFEAYRLGTYYSFTCSGGCYAQARPLTAAERDAIKVRD